MSQTAPSNASLSPLKRALLAIEDLEARLDAAQHRLRQPIAVIGMGCRIPGGADSPQAFWDLLRDGRNGVREVPPDRWDLDAFYDPNPDASGRIATKYAGFIDAVDQFDPQLFGISPREAQSMDPQQRLLLETAWEALEHAGQSPLGLSRTRTGVFVGMCSSDYAQGLLDLRDPAVLDMYYMSGIAHSVGSGRLSYVLGLQGPSVTLDTACSSSLVAVHLACQSLRAEECRMALAGGVNIILSPEVFATMSRARMLAPDGRCKTFDAAADGFVRGEGCGMLVLKRLADAQADGDPILAVIRGSAVNQDGPSSGLTAPNGPSQEAVIRDALANAGLGPADVSYVEAHGTGTSLGDPIEMQALGAVFGPGRDPAHPLVVGSLKTNVGHLEAAAGVAGLIKVVLALQHREIPRHLHFAQPSPHIPWDRIPVQIPVEHRAWTTPGARRIAGVSSFGFSGTNAHVVLEEAPEVAPLPPAAPERPLHVFTVSARTDQALAALCLASADRIASAPVGSFPDLCHTAAAGRAHLARRVAVIAADPTEAATRLRACAAGESPAGTASGVCDAPDRPKVAFLFTGQGSQYAGMGRRLYETSPTFARAVDRCATALQGRLPRPLLDVLFPAVGAATPIDETQYTQPALFAVEYALAELWRSWGVQPSFVLGHSVGEYVAACLAGVFSPEDGIALIAERARLMQAQPPGGRMVAVMAAADVVRELIAPARDQVAIAALNGPRQTVISGSGPAIERLLPAFASAGCKTKELVVSHAFHSPLMDPMLDSFERAAGTVPLQPPVLRLISNLTGRVASASELTQAAYWRRHVREAVHFAPSMQTLAGLGCTTFLEIGPAPVLLGLGRGCVDTENSLWLPSLRQGRDDWGEMLGSLTRLHTAGVAVDWAGFDRDYPRRKAHLPTYRFTRQRYWSGARPGRVHVRVAAAEPVAHPLAARRIESPALRGVVFETPLSAATPAFIADHRVFDRIIFPATGHLETVRTCARLGLGWTACELADVTIGEALAVAEDETRRMQVVFTPREDGSHSFEVVSTAASAAAWRIHASGSVRLPAGAPVAPTAAPAAPTDSAPVDANDIYAAFARRGLGFGPRFRGVREAWRGDRRARGRIEAPDALAPELADYELHPALLDACIQVLAAATGEGTDEDTLFMPLGVESYRVFAPCPRAVWSEVELDGATTGETFRATIRVTADTGALIAELRGMAFKRASRASVARSARPSLEGWMHQVTWPAHTAARSVALPEPASLAPRLGTFLDRVSRETGLAKFAVLRPRLEQACAGAIGRALSALGCSSRPGESFEIETLAATLGVVQEQRRLFGRLIAILAEEGLVALEGSRGRWQRPLPAGDALAALTALQREFPEFDAALAMTIRCAEKFAEALSGRADPLQLLFPAGDLTAAERLYQHSPAARTYNPLLREAVQAALEARPTGPIRILEVGGGTGSTSAHVLSALPADRTEYTFTDMSPHFLAKARAKFAAYPFVRYQLFDLEADPAGQGLEPGSFDIVIGANCIHATADLRATLRHVRSVLAPGGWLLMLEVTRPQRWFDLTFGLTDGWWRFRDADLRTGYPLLPRRAWSDLLESSGFEAVATQPPAEANAAVESADDALIVARAARTTAAGRRCLLLPDEGGVAIALAERLRAAGESCVVASADDLNGEAAALDALLAPASDVVDLRALDAGEAGDLHTATVLSTQPRALGGALRVIQALARRTDSPARLWILTRGAQAAGGESALAPAAAGLWGLARTATLEHPELRCVRIDLDPADRTGEVDACIDLLRTPSDEDQFAIRGGAVRVARLENFVPHPAPLPDFLSGAAGQPYRLTFRQRGSIDHLELGRTERRPPGPGEVEIRVRATALNFRDVMNVMGLYPGDPGPLGAECSGEIVAIGAGVTDLAVGDPVLAFAGGSFSAYVTTQRAWVARKPEGMTFEHAASLPIAYMTAHFTLVHLGKLKAGETVLIHAAAGGVGLAAVALARRAGATIFGTAGTPEKRALLRSLGVAHALDSRSLGFADEVLRLTGGRGVDVVLNSLADQFVDRSLEVVAHGGRFLEIGKRGIWEPERVARLGKAIDYHVVDWGVDARANPALIGAMLDELMQAFARGELPALPCRVFALSEAPAAFRFMAQGRHTGKIVVSHRELHQAAFRAADAPVRADGTYLVTGGLRGIGWLTARWLIERGARHLVLTGRRGPDAVTQAEIERLAAEGVRILVAQADVADAAAMGRWLAQARRDHPPLRGVIHSAGALDDGILAQQDWKRFRTVLGPKVDGSMILHELTLGDPLDFFVLYSSVAGVFGSAGQANHSAANVFMDAFAAARRAAGLPALSVSWGAWSGAGAAVDRGVMARAAESGYGMIDPASGLHALDTLLRHDTAHVAVSPMDWGRFARKFARGGRIWPFLAARAKATPAAAAGPTETPGAARPAVAAPTGLAERLARSAPNQRRSLVAEQIRTDAARILGLPAGATLPNNKPLTELGLDSLMAVELRNALGTAVSRSLPATLLFDYPTVDALTGHLCKSVLGIDDSKPPGGAAASSGKTSATASNVLGQIEDLDDDAIDRLLQQRGMKKP